MGDLKACRAPTSTTGPRRDGGFAVLHTPRGPVIRRHLDRHPAPALGAVPRRLQLGVPQDCPGSASRNAAIVRSASLASMTGRSPNGVPRTRVEEVQRHLVQLGTECSLGRRPPVGTPHPHTSYNTGLFTLPPEGHLARFGPVAASVRAVWCVIPEVAVRGETGWSRTGNLGRSAAWNSRSGNRQPESWPAHSSRTSTRFAASSSKSRPAR